MGKEIMFSRNILFRLSICRSLSDLHTVQEGISQHSLLWHFPESNAYIHVADQTRKGGFFSPRLLCWLENRSHSQRPGMNSGERGQHFFSKTKKWCQHSKPNNKNKCEYETSWSKICALQGTTWVGFCCVVNCGTFNTKLILW